MHIWVDADACPAVIKEILIRASRRTLIPLTFIANHSIKVPVDSQIQFFQVASGFDMADMEIGQRVQVNDLVITADIPLANEVIERGGICLSPRGDLMDKSNIAARLTMRNFMDTMRSSGVNTGGQNAFNHRDRMHFANQLDRIIAST